MLIQRITVESIHDSTVANADAAAAVSVIAIQLNDLARERAKMKTNTHRERGTENTLTIFIQIIRSNAKDRKTWCAHLCVHFMSCSFLLQHKHTHTHTKLRKRIKGKNNYRHFYRQIER